MKILLILVTKITENYENFTKSKVYRKYFVYGRRYMIDVTYMIQI